MKPRLLDAVAGLALLLGLGTAHAAAEDMKQPVFLEADQVVIDEPKGVSRYTGHVRMTQGGMTLTAETVEVTVEGKQLRKVVAKGDPVRFTSKSVEQKETRAQADHMEYRVQEGILLMRGAANLWQSGNEFSGGVIEFDMRHDRVIASRGTPGEAPVRVIIMPGAAEGETPPAPTPTPAGSAP
ncbi:MAG: lipopolysaccharide transport periplasmic protein LptA [Pseudomonadota bacterium]